MPSLVERAAKFGHAIKPKKHAGSRGRWRPVCACGWSGSNGTRREAVGYGNAHAREIVERFLPRVASDDCACDDSGPCLYHDEATCYNCGNPAAPSRIGFVCQSVDMPDSMLAQEER